MRFYGVVLLASAVALGACGGGDKQAATDTATKNSAPAAAAATVPAAPATGATHEVKMLQDDKGYHFDPAALTIKEGDAVKFTVVSAPPHNIAFDPATTPPAAVAQLDANMSAAQGGEMSSLNSPQLMNVGDSYTISFAKVPAGTYNVHCTPHTQYGMAMTITVQ